ncbi:osmotically inducible protein OsmC [Bdellovibrio sp. qaytius]|nr:osmotically inducible protein OsmC [Bdellovibrio sp. qaytius]
MVNISSTYTGQKHCEATHGPSNSVIHTDAPKDNNGLGETFSPTDLVATAVGTCILTTVAIFAEKENISIVGATSYTEKVMTPPPRRIGSLKTVCKFPNTIPEEFKKRIPEIAEMCPVKKSLHPDVVVDVEILFV